MPTIYKWMLARLIIVFFLMIGIAYGQNGPHVDDDLRMVVRSWLEDCEKYRPLGWETYYHFDSILVDDMMEYNMLGVCIPHKKTILINRQIIGDEFLLKLVVYHELGHCMLGKGHICSRISLMNPTMEMYSIREYEELWNVLLMDYMNGVVGIPCPEFRCMPSF